MPASKRPAHTAPTTEPPPAAKSPATPFLPGRTSVLKNRPAALLQNSSSSSAIAFASSSGVMRSRCVAACMRLCASGSYRMLLTASLCRSRQNAMRAWKAACGSPVLYTSATSLLAMKPPSWSMTASMPPSRIALATMHSVSSTLERCSFAAMSCHRQGGGAGMC
eukprot:366238-Chlamydomonas_euryale.AAC.7